MSWSFNHSCRSFTALGQSSTFVTGKHHFHYNLFAESPIYTQSLSSSPGGDTQIGATELVLYSIHNIACAMRSTCTGARWLRTSHSPLCFRGPFANLRLAWGIEASSSICRHLASGWSWTLESDATRRGRALKRRTANQARLSARLATAYSFSTTTTFCDLETLARFILAIECVRGADSQHRPYSCTNSRRAYVSGTAHAHQHLHPLCAPRCARSSLTSLPSHKGI